MKKLLIIMSLCLVITTISGCTGEAAGKNRTETTKEYIDMSDTKLISTEELISISGISADDYNNIDLEQFIEDYEITEENVTTLNIKLLLEEYDIISNKKDINYIFDDPKVVKESDFTEEATAIAFYENINTGSHCIYYDLVNNLRYETDQGFLFDDLDQTEPIVYSQGQKLLEKLDTLGVFKWESISDTDGIDDYQSMALVVLYKDGSAYKVAASGVLSQLLPSNYDTVVDTIFNGF